MRIIDGVTPDVNAKMDACNANVLMETGLLLRTCVHGTDEERGPLGTLPGAHQHPVGHLDFAEVPSMTLTDHAKVCDGCCVNWRLSAWTPMRTDEDHPLPPDPRSDPHV